jgi:ferritin-like metal-binding protein YciE
VATPIAEPRQLFLHQLRTMLWIELKLADEVLPELYGHVHAVDLKWALERHRHETEGHVKNLRRVFHLLEEPGDPEESAVLLGLTEEHDRLMRQLDLDRTDVVDLFHLDVIARTEHLEIAAYDGLVHAVQALGADAEAVLLLRENLEQEEHALEQAEHALTKLLAEKVESLG